MSKPYSLGVFPAPLLAPKGLLILACGLVVPIAALIASIPLFVALSVLSVFLFCFTTLILYDYIRVKTVLKTLSVVVDPPQVAYSGCDAALTIKGHFSKPPLNATLLFRPAIPPTSTVTRDVHRVDIHQEVSRFHISHIFRPLARGDLSWNIIDGRIRNRHSLAWWQFHFRITPAVGVTVIPNRYADREKGVMAFRRSHPGERLIDYVAGEGREFDSLRKYTPGDDLRRVDWKRSARGRGLFVRVYRPETHQRIHIALDCGRRMANQIDERLQIEHAADAASALVSIAGSNDDEVGLFAFHHKVVTQIECRKGTRHLKYLTSALTQLELGEVETDYQLLTEWAHINRRRSLMVLITSISNPASLDQIRRTMQPIRRKHLPMVFAIADHDLHTLTQEQAEGIDQAYVISAAVEQQKRIRARANVLEQSGIGCIYCPVDKLSEMLRAKYYQLKLTGKW